MRKFCHALRSILVVISLLIGSQAFGQTNLVPDDVEFQALKDLYMSTVGSTWKTKTGWPTTTWPATATAAQMDTWFGIVVTDGDITGITLINNTMKGSLPTSIGNLTALTSLKLLGNQIAGSIPTSIGSLTNLTYLGLGTNNFTGNIPAEIGGLVKLKELILYHNALTGAIPNLCALVDLVALRVNNNTLNGTIPSCILSLPLMTAIDLSANSLSGNVPPFGNTNFETIELSLNKLTGEIPSLNGMTNLTTADLSRNLFTAMPSDYQGLVNLAAFYLYSNKITGTIPSSLGSVSSLVFLSLQDNLLSGGLPPELGNLYNLKTLSLHTNQLTGTIPESYSALTKLESLSLSFNKLSGELPDFIGDLATLKTLALSGNEFEGELPFFISKLTNLTVLQLSDNKFFGTFPEEYGNLTNLTHLYVDQNRLEGELPQLTSLTKLQYLFLGKNYFRGSVPVSYAAFTDIRVFNIDNNYLSGDFPSIFSNWTKVITLGLYNNQFTGDFPSSIGNCAALSGINCMDNRFTSIPVSIMSLPAVTSINFRSNRLTTIPDFSNYSRRALVALSLQNNQIGLDGIEPLYDIGGVGRFKSQVVHPQIFRAEKMDVPAGQELLIKAASKGTFGSIEWEKLSGTTWSSVNAMNEDATQQTFKIAVVADQHKGQYRWRATTTKIPTWITQSEAITVNVVDAIPGTASVKRLYNGMISSVRWRTNKAYDSKGSDLTGIYLYEYDDKYQIQDARFGQVTWAGGSQAYTSYQIENNKYRLTGMSYDPNGNIKTLHRFNDKGERIHNFDYHYLANTNKLTDVSGYVNSYQYDALGRMVSADKTEGEDQYVDYDVTGKVVAVYTDQAKTIKKVEYQYDDHGFRLAKVVLPPPGSSEVAKTTWYIRDAAGSVTSIYEQDGEPSAQNMNPLIQKEIPIYGAGKLGTYYPEEDGSVGYELTDHLGNVRAIVRDDVRIYTATMEDSGQEELSNPRVQELNYFTKITETAFDYAPMNHTENTATVVTTPSRSAYLKWQDGIIGSEAVDKGVGPSIALKVSEGDKISAEVFARYKIKTSYPRNGFTMSVLSSILGGNYFGGDGFEGSTISQAAQSFNNALTGGGFLSDGSDNTLPHAYLNYLVLDVAKNRLASGYKRVTEDGGFEAGQETLPDMHERLTFDAPIVIPAGGQFVFVWLSNESEATDVWFDDLKVTHQGNFVKEATDYGVWGEVLRTSANDQDKASAKDGLMAQYSLNGNASDTGGRSLNGVVTGAQLITDRNGNANGAYSFDGVDDRITIAGVEDDVSFIPNTGVFTISMFVKINDLEGRNTFLGNTASVSARGFVLMYDNATGVYDHQLRFQTSTGQTAKVNEVLGRPRAITDNEWHHVVAVGDGSSIRLYLDGYEDGYSVGTLYYGTGNSAGPLAIGHANSTSTTFMKGAIDEVQIFERALSDAEIRLLANDKTLEEIDYVLQPRNKYRYGYQGQFAERDEETGWNHFELREYDPIVGRWLSIDPYGQYWSPYNAYGNDPVNNVDETGGMAGPGTGGPAGSPTFTPTQQLLNLIVDGVTFLPEYVVTPTAIDGVLDVIPGAYGAVTGAVQAAIENPGNTARDMGMTAVDAHPLVAVNKAIYSAWNGDASGAWNSHPAVKAGKQLFGPMGDLWSAAASGDEYKLGKIWGNNVVGGALMMLTDGAIKSLSVKPKPAPAAGAEAATKVGLQVESSVAKVMGNTYQAAGEVVVPIKNTALLTELNASSQGGWVKVYEAGLLNGSKVETHYFRNNTTGQVFDVKTKYNYWHQKAFKKLAP